MKDKLRELAERLATRIGSQPCTSISSKEVCEFLAILDAEGDGGAVGVWTDQNIDPTAYSYAAGVMGTCPEGPTDGALKRAIASYLNHSKSQTPPARSGVVSDEDVSVVAKMIADKCGNGMREKYEELAKQIAEHFAAIAQEKQS